MVAKKETHTEQKDKVDSLWANETLTKKSNRFTCYGCNQLQCVPSLAPAVGAAPMVETGYNNIQYQDYEWGIQGLGPYPWIQPTCIPNHSSRSPTPR